MTEKPHAIRDEKMENLLNWLAPDAVISPKIGIKHLQGRGRSVVVKEPIPLGSLLIMIRRKQLLNITTVPNRNTRLSSHQQLAWFIYQYYQGINQTGDQANWKAFLDLMPTVDDFAEVPLTWSEKQMEDLPEGALKHLRKQRKTYQEDYKHVVECVGSEMDIDEKEFLHCWLCVNTRCLFMDLPGAEHKDRLTMAPYVDFLNHLDDNSQTVRVKMSAQGMEVYATRKYEPGEEIYLHYGPHDNTFLLCEYGFVFEHNRWDTIDISSSIMSFLSEYQQTELKELGYLGDYTVNRNGPSFRTEVALACWQQGGATNQVRQFAEGFSEGDKFERRTKVVVLHILKELSKDWKGPLLVSHMEILRGLEQETSE